VKHYQLSCEKYEGNSISKLQIVIEKNRMEIMTYKQHLFFNNLYTNLNTCPTVSQAPGNLRRKILLVAVGITRALLFQLHHRQESVLPKNEISAPNYGLPDMTGNVHRTWAAFLCGYPLLPCFLPTKNRTTPRCSIVVHVFRGAAIL
jgi:hypothetical protein